jgi:hypothetical protein
MNQLLYDIAHLNDEVKDPNNTFLIEAVTRLVDGDTSTKWKFIKENCTDYKNKIKTFSVYQLGLIREEILGFRHTSYYKILDMFNVEPLRQ